MVWLGHSYFGPIDYVAWALRAYYSHVYSVADNGKKFFVNICGWNNYALDNSRLTITKYRKLLRIYCSLPWNITSGNLNNKVMVRVMSKGKRNNIRDGGGTAPIKDSYNKVAANGATSSPRCNKKSDGSQTLCVSCPKLGVWNHFVRNIHSNKKLLKF